MKVLLSFLFIFFTCTTYAQLPISGLVAWYPFCGDHNDYSGNGYNLINSGATLTTDRFANTSCAYYFDGINDIMYHNPPLPTDLTNFTYSAWFQLDTPGNMVIVANGDLNKDGYEMLITGPALLSLGNDVAVIFGGVAQYLPTVITLHQWHQTVLRKTAPGAFDLIIDTVLVGSFTGFYNLTNPSEYFAIGKDYTNGTNPFQGKIDDIAVYNRALSDLEIRQLYHYNPYVAPFTLGNDTTICSGSLVLSPSSSYSGPTYTWSTGATTTSVSVSSSGSYWLKINNKYGCSATDTISVTIGSITVDLGPDTGFCIGGSVMLTSPKSPPLATYLWSTGSIAHSITVTSPGKYWLQVTSGSCSASDTIYVSASSAPVVNLGNDTSVCAYSPLVLSSIYPYSGVSYSWNTGAMTPTLTTSLTGSYWLKVTKMGCFSSDTINVVFKPLPVIGLGPDISFCQGGSIVLFSPQPPGAIYSWSTGSSTNTISVSSPGIYWLTVSDNGCLSSDTVQIKMNPIPSVDLGTDITACSGETISLKSSTTYSSASYMWNTGSTNSKITVSTGGIYTLSITKDGCTGSASTDVYFKPQPIPIVGNDTTICENDVITIGALESGSATYLWNTGSTNSSISINKEGVYSLTKMENNCSASASIKITTIKKPEIYLGADTSLCLGQVLLLLSPVSNSSIDWSNGTQNTSLFVNQQGEYWGTLSNVCGSVTDTISVDFTPCNIWFPSAFTPNSDGQNDIIRVGGNLEAFRDFSLSIYNRYGQRIFFTQDIYEGWDGTYMGAKEDLGSYFYYINYSLNAKKGMMKGDFQLIR